MLKLIINEKNELFFPKDDEIIDATLAVKEGKVWKR